MSAGFYRTVAANALARRRITGPIQHVPEITLGRERPNRLRAGTSGDSRALPRIMEFFLLKGPNWNVGESSFFHNERQQGIRLFEYADLCSCFRVFPGFAMGETKYGDWVVLEELGRGGQGVVYKAARNVGQWYDGALNALHETSGVGHGDSKANALDRFMKAVEQRLNGTWTEMGALKVLHEPTDKDAAYQQALKRAQTMLKVLRSIEHPNIVPLLDYNGSAGDWMVFKYFKNKTLSEQREIFKGDVMGAVSAFRGLVEGVAKLHSNGAIHRDIKPANIFVDDQRQLVLGDLGLVHFEDGRTRVTETYEKVGTTDFMPTWLISRDRMDQVRTTFDVFALGKILWCLISGERVLRLHYIEEEENDLRKLFSENPAVQIVHEQILAKTVVEHERNCLKDAASLLEVVDSTIARLDAESHSVCKCCGKGRYVGDVVGATGSPRRFTLACDRCGHILELLSGKGRKLPDWVKKLKSKNGVLE